MGYRNREIEIKLVVAREDGRTTRMASVEKIINKLFKKERTRFIDEFSKDVFFRIPKTKKKRHGFGRVRWHPNGGGQLTVKLQDKGGNIDRIEVDVDVKDPKQAVKFMRSFLGQCEVGELLKAYCVHVLEDEFVTISVYRVHLDPRVFVEVEARSHKRMLALEKRVVNKLQAAGFKAERVGKSLYDLFFNSKGK